MILDDAELHEDGYPLPLGHVVRMVKAAKLVLFNGCCAQASGVMEMPTTNTTEGSTGEGEYGAFLVKALARMLRSLYDRWSRRPFCVPEVRFCFPSYLLHFGEMIVTPGWIYVPGLDHPRYCFSQGSVGNL